ncbi:hypothetical protein [Lyngbya confervoides]|uniref:Uncharacterized protein n=1 Tax=Lyngbya confervoides BDU141951 TaxID=1574623 RepID=A0ABD4T4R9_9CYAN|nr:hypothetical protein [Lyngbya confervoides]MCM1983232.1 hypothetical protein [Lyngbya confervoides BDU141951]
MMPSLETWQPGVVPRFSTMSNPFVVLLRGFRQRRKTHRFWASDTGTDFEIDQASTAEGEFYMTAQRWGVRSQDYIEIQDAAGSTCYQVLDIDHYSDRPDMWIARLIPIDQPLDQP